MARYIDANLLLEQLNKKKLEVGKVRYVEGFNDAIMRVRSMISSSATADAVDVVRCKDCRHWYSPTKDDAHYCRIPQGLNGVVAEEDFCSYGRRK